MAAPACVTADLTRQRRYSGQRNYIPGRVPDAPTSLPQNRSSSKLPREVCKHEKEQSPRIQTSPLEESCGLCERGSNRSGYLGAKPVNIRLSVRTGPAEEAGPGPRDRSQEEGPTSAAALLAPRAWPSPAGAVPRGSPAPARRPRTAESPGPGTHGLPRFSPTHCACPVSPGRPPALQVRLRPAGLFAALLGS